MCDKRLTQLILYSRDVLPNQYPPSYIGKMVKCVEDLLIPFEDTDKINIIVDAIYTIDAKLKPMDYLTEIFVEQEEGPYKRIDEFAYVKAKLFLLEKLKKIKGEKNTFCNFEKYEPFSEYPEEFRFSEDLIKNEIEFFSEEETLEYLTDKIKTLWGIVNFHPNIDETVFDETLKKTYHFNSHTKCSDIVARYSKLQESAASTLLYLEKEYALSNNQIKFQTNNTLSNTRQEIRNSAYYTIVEDKIKWEKPLNLLSVYLCEIAKEIPEMKGLQGKAVITYFVERSKLILTEKNISSLKTYAKDYLNNTHDFNDELDNKVKVNLKNCLLS